MLMATMVSITAACSSLQNASASNPSDLRSVLSELPDIPGLESLAVWRDDEMVVEEYLVGGPHSMRDIRSVTKSITSLLVGLAIAAGHIEGVEASIGAIEPKLGLDHPDKADVSVRDLLTMTAGVQWDESQLGEYLSWRNAADPVGHYLNRPVVSDPGEVFAYSSGASQLLGRMVAAASGQDLDEFASAQLFRPMGLDEPTWEQLADGTVNAASGLDITTRDLLALGRMLKDGGIWDGQQMVPREWIDDSMRRHVDTPAGTSYGYHWWVEEHPTQLIVASGYGGQTLAIAPDAGLVLVATAAWDIPAEVADSQSAKIVTFLRERLAPALIHGSSSSG